MPGVGGRHLIDCVVTFGAGHFYVSQSDKGGLVFGGNIDGYNSYAQRRNLPVIEDVMEAAMALWPALGRVRVLRHWGGIVDMSMDGSPIIDHTPVQGLYLNAGCQRSMCLGSGSCTRMPSTDSSTLSARINSSSSASLTLSGSRNLGRKGSAGTRLLLPRNEMSRRNEAVLMRMPLNSAPKI